MLLSDVENKTSEALNKGGIADLPLLKTLLAIPQVMRAKFLENDTLFYFTRTGKFSTFNNPFEIQSIFSVGKSEKNKDFYELTAQAV